MAVLFECKATILFFYRLPVRKENMIREKLKLFMYQKLKIKSDYTYQGVPQGRKKLHCGTPFLMVRNLSDFSFCCSLSVAYLCAKSGWNGSAFGRGFRLGLLLHGGLF